MLCYVVLPNGFLLEIVLSQKAKGQECLDKVCDKLKIMEVDYFGLQYANKNGELYWLNLRNPIRQQSHAEPIRLYLKVKFYVPPYLIQQESTRHQFYLTICASLKQRQLKVSSISKQAKLIALIAQAEIGNYRSESFDLKQLYSEWILLFGDGNCHWEQPSVIEPNSAHKRRKHHSGCSLDENANQETQQQQQQSVPRDEVKCASAPNLRFTSIERLSSEHSPLYHSIVEFHRQLSGYLPSKAESVFLEEISELEDIGVDYFSARIENEHHEKCKIGVGTRGVTIRKDQPKVINYSALVKVRTSTHFFTLKYIEDNGDVKENKFRLTSTKSANALYRVVTEKHVFYSCDTVVDSVATQCILGISGMFWSIAPAIFKDDPEVGKNFVFDIRRTLRQFYDDVQRRMYKLKTHLNNNLALDQLDSPTCDSLSDNYATLDQQTAPFDDKLLCRICFDRHLGVAFISCGHVCCEECSNDCDSCPVCRAPIEDKLKIFL